MGVLPAYAGMILNSSHGHMHASVLPAYAGMILTVPQSGTIMVSAPRIRGDDPKLTPGKAETNLCSPHTRG